MEVLLWEHLDNEAARLVSIACYNNSSGLMDLGRLMEAFLIGLGPCSSSESMTCFSNLYISSIVFLEFESMMRFTVCF